MTARTSVSRGILKGKKDVLGGGITTAEYGVAYKLEHEIKPLIRRFDQAFINLQIRVTKLEEKVSKLKVK